MDIDEPQLTGQASVPMEQTGNKVNVFDYQVPHFDEDIGPGQEMQERSGRPLLSRTNTANPTGEATWDVMDDVKSAS